MKEQALQDRYAPKNACFGCGPANPKGLQVKSYVQGDEVVACWRPEPHHEAFPDVLNGGIIGTLLDCHSNWTAAHRLMNDRGVDHPPCTVTMDYAIALKRPTPTTRLLELRAKVLESDGTRAKIAGELRCDGKLCAASTGTFVAVEEGHPAFHRW